MGSCCCKTEIITEPRPQKFELSLLNKCHNVMVIGSDDDFDTRVITNIIDYRCIKKGILASTNYGFMLDFPNRKTAHYSIVLTEWSSNKYEEFVTDSMTRSYIILDNVINDTEIANITLTEALKESTNFSTTLFIRNNTAIKLDSDVRELIDMIFIKADQHIGNSEIIYDQYIKSSGCYVTGEQKINLSTFTNFFNKYEYNNNVYIVLNLRSPKKGIYYYCV